MNPFVSFCLYVAARVFVQYLKSRPDDSQTADSLRFLLAAMNALKRKNPLTESFLVQLDVDLEALGMRIPKLKSAFPRSGDCGPTAPQLRKHRKNPNCEGITAQHIPYGGYQNDCPLSREGGNPGNAHGLSDGDKQNQMGGGQQQPCPNNFSGQDWMSEDQLPTRERGCPVGLADGNMMIPPDVFGTASAAARGFMDSSGSSGEANDLSPNTDGVSNRPTPNSSTTTSDHRQSGTGTSGSTPFDTSPIGSNRNLGTQAEMDAAAAAASSFFPDSIPASFHLSGNNSGGTGLTPGQTFSVPDTPGNDFNLPNGWASQTMTPVAEGMLRHLMDMPMDNMDLSGWDSGT
ncbi:putative binuclear zinc transcription factor protein [Eutypa lata UCREL1]|uniref:Putative binuclear zinc transcription factor protein n=1 Tax=Eutypa lata (strain UCR-EL1) TaxID=1287681 RepID=M7TMN4_EUTLA|nr:putative binuclear zinc transcription factor protein [Eutypa lata UCREL1]